MRKNKALYSVVLKVIVRKAKTVEFEKIKPDSKKKTSFKNETDLKIEPQHRQAGGTGK